MESLVKTFCKGFEPVDDAVLTYLVSILDEIEEDDADLEEIEDVFSGFFPTFAAMQEGERNERIWDLVQKVRQLKLLGVCVFRQTLCRHLKNF